MIINSSQMSTIGKGSVCISTLDCSNEKKMVKQLGEACDESSTHNHVKKGSVTCNSCNEDQELGQDLQTELHKAHIKPNSSTHEEKMLSAECLSSQNCLKSPTQLFNHFDSICCTTTLESKTPSYFHGHDPLVNGDVHVSMDGREQIPPNLVLSHVKRKRGRPPKANSKKVKTSRLVGMVAKGAGSSQSDAVDDKALEDDITFASIQLIREKIKRYSNAHFKCEKVKGFFAEKESYSKDESIGAESKNKFWCKICGCSFLTREKLLSHQSARTHLRKVDEMNLGDGKNYECQICGRLFYALNALQFHELNHALGGTRQPKSTNDLTKGNGLIKSEKSEFSIEDADAKVNALLEQVRSAIKDGDGKVVCPECGKKLSKNGILSHLRQHNGSLPFRCTFCMKLFTNVTVLKRHLKVHLGIMYYKCPICKKQFSRKLTMEAHAIREHEHEVEKHGVSLPRHQCSQCGRQFMQLNQLTAHMKLHDKKLKCPHPGCTSLFRYKSELAVHLKTHSTEHHFLCDECGYSGKSRHQLKRHQRLHAGDKRYQCSSCDYKTTLAANLRRHERVHTGSKPYKCLYCGYSCNTQENLRKHILKTRRHAGKFVYPCQVCDFGTNSAQDFQQHLETKHQQNRQTLPSILVGMYQPDDKKNKSDTGITLSITCEKGQKTCISSVEKIPNSTYAKDESQMEQISDSGLFNKKPESDFSLQQSCPDLQNCLAREHISSALQSVNVEHTSNSSTHLTESPNSQNLLHAKPLQFQSLILPAPQSSSLLNSMFRMQPPNHIIQNVNAIHLPLIPLNSVSTVQQPNMVLPEITDDSSNIKLALQLPGFQSISNNSSNLTNEESDLLHRTTFIMPDQLLAILQNAQSKQFSNNNVQTSFSVFIPGIEESQGTISNLGS